MWLCSLCHLNLAIVLTSVFCHRKATVRRSNYGSAAVHKNLAGRTIVITLPACGIKPLERTPHAYSQLLTLPSYITMVNLTILAGGYATFVASYLFDSDAGSLTLLNQSPTGANPSWITLHPTNSSIL